MHYWPTWLWSNWIEVVENINTFYQCIIKCKMSILFNFWLIFECMGTVITVDKIHILHTQYFSCCLDFMSEFLFYFPRFIFIFLKKYFPHTSWKMVRLNFFQSFGLLLFTSYSRMTKRLIILWQICNFCAFLYKSI